MVDKPNVQDKPSTQRDPHEVVAAMNDHYLLTGAVRGSDIVGVLGDPLGTIGVQTSDQLTFSIKEDYR